MAKKKYFKRIYACIGWTVCLSYVLLIILGFIQVSGCRESMGNSDYFRYYDWDLERVAWLGVILCGLTAVSFVFSWLKYYKDMWNNHKFRLLVFDAKSIRGKIGIIAYMLFNILLIYSLADLCMIPETDCDGVAYYDQWLEKFFVFWGYWFYLPITIMCYVKYRNSECYEKTV